MCISPCEYSAASSRNIRWKIYLIAGKSAIADYQQLSCFSFGLAKSSTTSRKT
nr:MAG TPA: hypothetical protein [Caudoviricetes sp.]